MWRSALPVNTDTRPEPHRNSNVRYDNMHLASQLRLLTALYLSTVVIAAVTGWLIMATLSRTALDATQVRLPVVREHRDMDTMHDGLRAVAYSAVIAAVTSNANANGIVAAGGRTTAVAGRTQETSAQLATCAQKPHASMSGFRV